MTIVFLYQPVTIIILSENYRLNNKNEEEFQDPRVLAIKSESSDACEAAVKNIWQT